MMNAIDTIPPTVSSLFRGMDSIIIVNGIHPNEMGNDSKSMHHQEKNEIKAQITPNAKHASNART